MIDYKEGDYVRIREGCIGNNYNWHPTISERFYHYYGSTLATFKVLKISVNGNNDIVLGMIDGVYVSFNSNALVKKTHFRPTKRIKKHILE